MPLNLPFIAGQTDDPKQYEIWRSMAQQALKSGDVVTVDPITKTVPANSSAPMTLGINPKSRINFQNAPGLFNIRAFGAKQDGATDDTAAIQATVNAAVAFGNGSVYTPQSKNPSLISSSIVVSSTGVRILGEAWGYFGTTYTTNTYSGSTWKWVGANGGKILKIVAANGVSIRSASVERMNFDGGTATGVTAIYLDGGNPATQVVNKMLVDGICAVRVNRVIQLGDLAGTGLSGQVDSCVVRRVWTTEPDNSTTSAVVYCDSGNCSDFWISDSSLYGYRYGIYIANIGYCKIGPEFNGGLPNTVLDLIYLDGNHGTIDIEQVQAESCNSTLKIAGNSTGVTIPITIRHCTLDSDTGGNLSTIQVGAQSLINSIGNTYNRPISFTAGASVFNSYGDTYRTTGESGGGALGGGVVVGATGTIVNRVPDGRTGFYGALLGATVPAANMDLALGSLAWRPANVTVANGANNDLAVGTGVFMVLAGNTGVANITGIAGGVNGRIITMTNSTGFAITLNFNNAGSAAANRMLFTGGVDIVLGTYNSVIMGYNNGIWYCLSR